MADQAKLLVAALQYKCSVNYMQLKVSKVNAGTGGCPPSPLLYLVAVGFGELLVG